VADAAGRAPGGHLGDGEGRQRVRWVLVRRRLLNLATVLSLLLLGATVVLWVRSYRILDEYCRLDDATGREDEVVLVYGGLHVGAGGKRGDPRTAGELGAGNRLDSHVA
jgi:hypothetical protein